jgi:hypothetical protein
MHLTSKVRFCLAFFGSKGYELCVYTPHVLSIILGVLAAILHLLMDNKPPRVLPQAHRRIVSPPYRWIFIS